VTITALIFPLQLPRSNLRFRAKRGPRKPRGVDGRGKSRRKWVAAGEMMSVIEQPASAFAEHYFGRRTG
jgi:hypothetical protein